MVVFSAVIFEEDVAEDLHSYLRIMKDKFDIEVDLSLNVPITINLGVCVSDAVSDTNIIKGIKGQENKS